MSTRFTRVFAAASLLLIASQAMAQNWQWAQRAGANAFDTASAVATDTAGNVFMTGFYTNFSVTFGSTSLAIAGAADAFVVKYNSAGSAQWAIGAGGTLNDKATAIATDKAGNVYVTGYFASNTMTVGTITLTRGTGGMHDIFVAKISPTGTVLWASNTGQANNDIYPRAIAVDSAGRVYVAGQFTSTTANFTISTLSNTGANNTFDGFVIGLSSTGAIIWSRGIGSTGNDNVTGITAMANGDFYVTGDFNGMSLTAGSVTLNNVSSGSSDAFLVKYDYFGNAIWGKRFGTNLGDNTSGVAVDAAGNVYVSGTFYGSNFTFGSSTLSSAGLTDIFLAKFSSAGTELWAQGGGGAGMETSGGLRAGGPNRLYAAGSFAGTTMTIDGITLNNSGTSNIYLASYDTTGNVVWAKDNDAGVAYVISAAAYKHGNAYVCGSFSGTNATFSSSTLSNSLAGPTTDMFLARYGNFNVGVEEVTPASTSLKVYPNPAGNTLNVVTEGSNYASLRVYNSVGQAVLVKEINQTDKVSSLDISGLPAGVYFVQATGEGRASCSFVKK